MSSDLSSNSLIFLIISYEKSKTQIEKIINFIQEQKIIIQDISTDDGDLEDIFVRLTKN